MFISEIEKLERKEIFVKNALKKYGNKFDYSKVDYIDSQSKIIIVCKKHGDFLKTPAKHLFHKHSCPSCAKEGYSEAVKISKIDFMKKAKSIHGDKYNYIKTTIGRMSDKIEIYCNLHKQYFIQQQSVHLDGRIGCKECLRKIKEDYNHTIYKENFIQSFVKKFGDNYDFSQVKYINNTTPVIVKCIKHNIEFLQVNRNISRSISCSCPQCKKDIKYTK